MVDKGLDYFKRILKDCLYEVAHRARWSYEMEAAINGALDSFEPAIREIAREETIKILQDLGKCPRCGAELKMGVGSWPDAMYCDECGGAWTSLDQVRREQEAEASE